MLKPRRLKTLLASTACYSDSFSFCHTQGPIPIRRISSLSQSKKPFKIFGRELILMLIYVFSSAIICIVSFWAFHYFPLLYSVACCLWYLGQCAGESSFDFRLIQSGLNIYLVLHPGQNCRVVMLISNLLPKIKTTKEL
jgi:hypothetical protein